jgi:hypothetical protein
MTAQRLAFGFAAVALSAFSLASGCARGHVEPKVQAVAGQDPAQLWVEPKDIESRDLYSDPAAAPMLPDPIRAIASWATTRRVIAGDTTSRTDRHRPLARSRSSEEAQERGRRQPHSVEHRLPPARPSLHEVVAAHGRQAGGEAKPGRFRLDSDHKNVGTWDWSKENPFLRIASVQGPHRGQSRP